MPLSDRQITQEKPGATDRWLSGEKGLRLLIKPNGSKYWRLKYRFAGKQKTLALGVYETSADQVSLATARKMTIEARGLIQDGIDPGEEKKLKSLVAKIRQIHFLK